MTDQMRLSQAVKAVANRLRQDGLWTVALAPLLAGKRKSFQIIFTERMTPNEDERKRFYRACLQIPWLASGVRSAILRELGTSPRQYQRTFKQTENEMLREMVNEERARLRGKRPRGGVDDAAYAKVARAEGMTVEALRKRLQRDQQRRRK